MPCRGNKTGTGLALVPTVLATMLASLTGTPSCRRVDPTLGLGAYTEGLPGGLNIRLSPLFPGRHRELTPRKALPRYGRFKVVP
jgi:hypothetical protein